LIAAKATYLDGGPLPSTVVKDEYTFAHLAQWKRTPNGGFRCDLEPAACEALPFSAGAFRGTSEYLTRFAPPAWWTTPWPVLKRNVRTMAPAAAPRTTWPTPSHGKSRRWPTLPCICPCFTSRCGRWSGTDSRFQRSLMPKTG
jgi:hypothetical protein